MIDLHDGQGVEVTGPRTAQRSDAQAPAHWAAGRALPLDAVSVGAAIRAAHAAGELDLPLPGSGLTAERWRRLAALAALDLTLGRLAEAHTDATAVLVELGAEGLVAGGGLWGLWAAEPPGAGAVARRQGEAWVLTGRKPFCSGASVLDRALVSATGPDGRRLFAVDVRDVRPVPGTWPAVGMAASGSVTVDLPDVPARPVGGPGAYLDRPGFWHGAGGVAACWYGGAVGVGRALLGEARRRDLGPHALAHLGAVDAVLADLERSLEHAADAVDADPQDTAGDARLRAARLRARVEAGATEVLDRVGRALGAAPVCLDAVHARRVADLPVYLRQSHAERDLAELGALAVERSRW